MYHEAEAKHKDEIDKYENELQDAHARLAKEKEKLENFYENQIQNEANKIAIHNF